MDDTINQLSYNSFYNLCYRVLCNVDDDEGSSCEFIHSVIKNSGEKGWDSLSYESTSKLLQHLVITGFLTVKEIDGMCMFFLDSPGKSVCYWFEALYNWKEFPYKTVALINEEKEKQKWNEKVEEYVEKSDAEVAKNIE